MGRKSYNNLKTTHYGLIDWPSPAGSQGSSGQEASLTSDEKSKFLEKPAFATVQWPVPRKTFGKPKIEKREE